MSWTHQPSAGAEAATATVDAKCGAGGETCLHGRRDQRADKEQEARTRPPRYDVGVSECGAAMAEVGKHGAAVATNWEGKKRPHLGVIGEEEDGVGYGVSAGDAASRRAKRVGGRDRALKECGVSAASAVGFATRLLPNRLLIWRAIWYV